MHPYPVCATSRACRHLHLSLLAGPAPHSVPSLPTAVSWQQGVRVPSRGAGTQLCPQRYGTGHTKVSVARGQEHLGPNQHLLPLCPVQGLPWMPGHGWGHRNVAFFPARTLYLLTASSHLLWWRSTAHTDPGGLTHTSLLSSPQSRGDQDRKKQCTFLSSRAKPWRTARACAQEMLI